MFVLVHFFFPVWKNAGLHVYVCLCVCMRDVRRHALWYRESFRNAISSLSVYWCIHVGFIRIWKCCAAVLGLASPSVRSRSLAFSLRSFFWPRQSLWLAHALEMRGWREEGDQRQGRPTAYTRKLAIINRINTSCISDTFKSVCVCVGVCVCVCVCVHG